MGNCSSSDHNTGMRDLPVVCSASFGMGFGARGSAYAGVVMFVSGFGGVFGGRGVSDCLRLISGSAESGVMSASGLGSWAGRSSKAQIWDFPNISLFPMILSLKSFGNS